MTALRTEVAGAGAADNAALAGRFAAEFVIGAYSVWDGSGWPSRVSAAVYGAAATPA